MPEICSAYSVVSAPGAYPVLQGLRRTSVSLDGIAIMVAAASPALLDWYKQVPVCCRGADGEAGEGINVA